MRVTDFLRAGAIAAMATATVVAAPAAAQVDATAPKGVRTFDIAAGNMNTALDKWARQSGVQVLYRSADVRNLRSRGLRGDYSPEAALRIIIGDAGLVVRSDRSGAFAVVRGPRPAAPSSYGRPVQQTQGPVASAAPDEANAITEIVVMARRREEKLQQVPVAVTAISGADLGRQSVVSLADLTGKVPALQITPTAFGGNIPRFVIRGQSQLEPLFALDPSVTVYFADVVQARAQGLNATLYDLSSVQVLKGPQGTLFGRNSTGGAVLLVPQAPTTELGGYAQVEAGNFSLRSLEGAVNIPVSDNLQVRLSGRSYGHDGYTRDTYNGVDFDDADNWSLRLGVKARIGERFTNLLYINNFQAHENGAAYKLTSARATLANYALGGPALAEFAANQAEGFHSTRMNIAAGRSRTKTFGIENTSTFEVSDNASIKNIFGYRFVSSSSPFDFDGTSQNMYQGQIDSRGRQYSDELQILGKAFGNALDYIAGAYVFSENGRELQQLTLDYRPIFFQGVYGLANIRNTSKSVFAQATLHVPGIEGLSLTAGGRYTWDNRRLERQAFNNGICAISTADIGGTPVSPCERTGSYSHSEPTYTFGADWQITPQHMIYITTRRGYRSGGINERANLPSQFLPFQPEMVTDYEAGLKANWALGPLGSLRTDLAVYQQNYRGIQRTQAQTVGIAPNTTLITQVVNAAEARIRGLEVDTTWTPVPVLSLRGYFSLTDAKYQDWLVPLIGGGMQDRSDYAFANVPKYSGGVSATVRHRLPGAGGELVLQGDLYSQSHVQIADDQVSEGIVSGYTVANARVEWNEVLGSRLDLAVWVRNLTNEKYYTSGTSVAGAGLGFTVMTLSPPRTAGITAHFDF